MKSQTSRQLNLDDGDDACCASCDPEATRKTIVRIATWSNIAPKLQQYLDYFTMDQSEKEESNIEIRLSVFPSLRDLQRETIFDLKVQTGLYDGFVIPTMMMGDLYELQGLAPLQRPASSQVWKDLLPYYRNQVATLDGMVRGVPLFAGNQVLLVYRKDYLESKDLQVPKTWGEYIRVAAALHNQPLGPEGDTIYGSCMGRMSESACRIFTDERDLPCNSLSMTYLGMSMAPMNQVNGTSSGWLFDTSRGKMTPILDPTLDNVLMLMEQQRKYGAPNEMRLDATMNLELFRRGRCAMTFLVDHPPDVMSDGNVGIAPVPGSFNFVVRGSNELENCKPNICPYSTQIDNEWINRVPFGATDMTVGGVSAQASMGNQVVVKSFFEFVMNTYLNESANESLREQPLTYGGVRNSETEGYGNLMVSLTESENVAAPFRVPNAFGLMTELDTRVYDYLMAENFTDSNRKQVRETVAKAWTSMILRHDEQIHAIPITVFYEKSIGAFNPVPTSDLYIGWQWRAVGWSLGGLSCLSSVVFALWVWRYRLERVVRASQPMFLWMLCLGTFVMAACIFPFGVEDDMASYRGVEVACTASIWLYSLGYVITFCALFSKIWRINRVFREAKNLQRIKVEAPDVLFPFFLLFGVNFILLMVWSITDPLDWTRTPIEDPGPFNAADTSTAGSCDSEHYRLYLGILLGVNLLYSCIALIQAYECRRISTEYSESLWISGALFCIVQVWFIGLPVLKLVVDDPRATFLVKTAIIFISCMSTLLLLFVPKIRYQRQFWLERAQGGEEKVAVSTRTDERRESVTSHEHSQASDENNSRPQIQGMKWMGHVTVTEPEAPAATGNNERRKSRALSGVEGIRIIQSTGRHSEEVERLKKSLQRADARNRSLNDRLERIQEQLEQHLVARHPHGTHGELHIIRARPEIMAGSKK